MNWNKREITERLCAGDSAGLFAEAAAVREREHGREVHLRALLEFGNHCRADCLYCGLRRGNRAVDRFALMPDQIREIAADAVRAGFRTLVLQSGEEAAQGPGFIVRVLHDLRGSSDAAITLSAGEWPSAAYASWFAAGAGRYLLKFETSNAALYSRLRPGRRLQERLGCLRALRKAGYQVGTGFMVGLPGQTIADLAEDLILLQRLDPDMAGIGPFIPHPGTPLAGSRRADGKRRGYPLEQSARTIDCDTGELTLRCVALARLMNPLCHLPATTALGVSLLHGWQKALDAGANVIMLDVTPRRYRRLYDIYPGRPDPQDDTLEALRHRHVRLLRDWGYEVAATRGDSLRGMPPRAFEHTSTRTA